tara:strand:- start:1088 stop:1753 length:666 start_codon:yes stop_codon:yes gene_type:complete
MLKRNFLYLLFFYSIYNFFIFFNWYLGEKQIVIEEAYILSLKSSLPLFLFIILTHFFYHHNDSDAAKVVSYPPLIFLFSSNSGFLLATTNMYHLQLYKIPDFFDLFRDSTLGLIFIITAIVIISSALKVFKLNSEDPNPTTKSTQIFCHGIYKYTRNPMYLGLILFQVGLGMILSMTHIIFFSIFTYLTYRYGVIEKEEVYLSEKFGQSYKKYMQKTRRWF